MKTLAAQARRLYGAGTHNTLAAIPEAVGFGLRGATTVDRDARSPAAQAAAQTGVPVSFDHITPTITADTFKLPGGGATVDKARFQSFVHVIRDFERRAVGDPKRVRDAVGELGQKLLEMHIAEQRALHDHLNQPAAAQHAKVRAAWRQAFADDPEIGRNQRDTTLARSKAMLEAYGKARGAKKLADLRQLFTDTGVGDHPEFLRFVDYVTDRIAATGRGQPEQPRSGGAMQARRG